MTDTPKRPDRLFKYRSMAPSSLQFTKQLVLERKLYFPKPNDLNDPFELKPFLDFSATYNEKVKFAEFLIDKEYGNIGVGERDRRIRFLMSMDMEHIARRSFNLVVGNIGVCSLSSSNNDILMWPHYGDNHKGICVIINTHLFDKIRMPVGLTPPLCEPVIYLPRRPTYNHFKDDANSLMRATALTKGEPWAYEQEWRLVLSRAGGNCLQFPEGTIAGIILGARISLKDKMEALSWKKSINYELEYYQASFDKREYKIHVDKIS